MSITRRRFIGVGLGAAAGTAVGWSGGDLVQRIFGAGDGPPRPPGGPESFALSVCKMCPGGCGLRVRRIGARPVRLDGNPLHPVNHGRLCPKGQAALQALLHPDRLLTPLRREGPRGKAGSFRPATWDEALEEISVRLGLLRRQGRPESLVLLRGEENGAGARIAARFMQAFGSPNELQLTRGDEGARQALELMQGIDAPPTYDLASAEYVLSFGGALLEAWDAPVFTMRAYGELRQGRPGRRGKLVQVESRRSITASKADEWVGVRPGTEGLFAMGVASALVAEELYDKEFIARRTHQFEDYEAADGSPREGLRRILLRDFGLERVSRETGVSANRILQLARELAAARPGIALGPQRGQLLPGSLFDHMAAHLLNALVGNLDGPGGVLVSEPVPLLAPPALPADEVATAGRARPTLAGARRHDGGPARIDADELANALLSGSPYPTDALIFLGGDPAFAATTPDVLASAIEKVPLVVSAVPIVDDTALFADWILPQSHFLEDWDLDTTPPGVPFPVASLSQPVVSRAAEGPRSNAEILLELAHRLDAPVAEALPWAGPEELIRAEVSGLYEAQRGATLGTAFDEAWVRLMERAGWWAPGYRSEDELWQQMQSSGGWWDPFYDHWDWGRVLATPSRRFELRPEELRALAASRRTHVGALAAHTEATPGGDRRLALLLFEPLAFAGGTGAELPFLADAVDPTHGQGWDTWVELNHETAEELGIHDRQSVEVVSTHARIRARALVHADVLPGLACIPIGLGRTGGGRWATGVGANPLRLLPATREPRSGLPEPAAALVQVLPHSGARGRTEEV